MRVTKTLIKNYVERIGKKLGIKTYGEWLVKDGKQLGYKEQFLFVDQDINNNYQLYIVGKYPDQQNPEAKTTGHFEFGFSCTRMSGKEFYAYLKGVEDGINAYKEYVSD